MKSTSVSTPYSGNSQSSAAPGKHAAMELAHDSGQKPVKHQHHSGAGAMNALFDAVQSMSCAFVSGSTSSALPPASTDCITRAIWVLEAEEEDYGL